MEEPPLVDLGTIACGVPDPVLFLDGLGQLIWANDAAEALFGVSLDEGVGTNALDLVHPDDLTTAILAMGSVHGKEVGTLIELRLRTSEGWRLLEVRGRSVDEGLILCARDLTQRRRWEVAGDETAKFRSLTQNASSLILLVDAAGVLEGSNAALTRQLQVDQEQVEGRPFSELASAPDGDALDALVREMRDDPSRVSRSIEVHLQSAEGEPIPYALTLTNLIDDPTVDGIVVSGYEIADRVEAEERLRDANSLLAATLEATADGILVVDLDGRIVSANARFGELWGLSEEQISGALDQSLVSVVVETLVEPHRFLSKIEEVYAEPGSVSFDVLELIDGRVYERESRPQRVDGRICGRVWSFRDVTEHRRLQEELQRQAFHDQLTGLANNVLFRDRVSHSAARARRSGGRFAVLFIDLDGFKTVNDSLGHSAGDELLSAVSERLVAALRPGDTAARLGGDEFAVLVEDIEQDAEAVEVAERLLEVLRCPIALLGRDVLATASIGVAFGDADADSDELLRNADLAMYTAKRAGRNCHRVFEADMHLHAVERLEVEARLRGAAARGELVVHYQPMFDLSDGAIVGMEALVRWQHPERGLLGPAAFIPFAEESELISEVCEHVLRTACAELGRWTLELGSSLAPALSVNLAPRQLSDPTLVELVRGQLALNELDPSQLILEITENALVRDPGSATLRLRELSELGVRLAVDDFGTGYSALSYLQQFPIDILKIDKSFVDEIEDDASTSVAAAIVQLSHTLGLVCIAEGIEHEHQQRALTAAGCDWAQGFALMRPVASAAALEALRSRRSASLC